MKRLLPLTSTFHSPSKTKNPESRFFKGLNPEQLQAVLETEGPLLIIAGAGTGKTRVIAHRIASLLERTPSLHPENILALTFSRKAAEEMSNRIKNLLGKDDIPLGLFTFHGFCHQFLQEHCSSLGLPSDFQLLDRAESWIFLRGLLPDLKLVHYRNLTDPTAILEGFLRFIGRAKDELITLEEYTAAASAIKNAEERSKALEISRVYSLYQQRMRSERLLDFGDLIIETYRGLKTNKALLSKCATQYPYIVVDEFQDTNVAQIALLSLLASHSRNLCVVGDDDQAIYRFRGASFASFLLIQKSFPDMKTLRLTQNYRSTKRILAGADRVIRHNEPDRFDPKKHLWTENPEGSSIEVVVCQNAGEEARGAVQTIRSILEKQPESNRRFDQIAVLYRAHSHRNMLESLLKNSDIPFGIIGGTSLFEQPHIKDLISYLRILNDPDDSVDFFRIISHPAFEIPMEDRLVINGYAKEQRISLYGALKSRNNLTLSAQAVRSVGLFHETFLRWREESAGFGVEKWIPRFLQEELFRPAVHLSTAETQNWNAVLHHFLQLTHRYVKNHSKSNDLVSFLWYLNSYILSGETPPLEENLPGNQVRLMTVHQAKGLEFEWVILLGMVQGRFPSNSRQETVPFPVELMKEILPQGDSHLQEERRLFYVACTRARQGLFFITQDRSRHRPSPFLLEMQHKSAVGDVVSRTVFPAPHIQSAESPLFDIVKGESKWSYTQLETYRSCPLRYKYKYIYKIPSKSSPHRAFGIDLHATLEDFFKKVTAGTIPSVEEFLKTFRDRHSPGRYGESYQDKEYLQFGQDILVTFYKKHEGSFKAPLFLEKQFLLPLGDGWIRGVVDRIDELPEGGVEILDYKSGRPKKTADAQEQLQIRLYALAAREVLQLEPKKISFYYLQSNEKLSFDQTEEDFDQAREQMKSRIQDLLTGDFTPAPSKIKCRWCDFSSLCPVSMA